MAEYRVLDEYYEDIYLVKILRARLENFPNSTYKIKYGSYSSDIDLVYVNLNNVKNLPVPEYIKPNGWVYKTFSEKFLESQLRDLEEEIDNYYTIYPYEKLISQLENGEITREEYDMKNDTLQFYRLPREYKDKIYHRLECVDETQRMKRNKLFSKVMIKMFKEGEISRDERQYLKDRQKEIPDSVYKDEEELHETMLAMLDCKRYECPICYEKVSVYDTYFLKCGHRVCLQCYREYVDTKLEGWTDLISCPMKGCDEKLRENDIKYIYSIDAATSDERGSRIRNVNASDKERIVTWECCDKVSAYVKKVANVRNMGLETTCPNCEIVFCHIKGEEITKCPRCGVVYEIKSRRVISIDVPEEDSESSEEQLEVREIKVEEPVVKKAEVVSKPVEPKQETKQEVKQETKKVEQVVVVKKNKKKVEEDEEAVPPGMRVCPNCGLIIVKIAECNHIRCCCGKHFCYYCGAGPWDDGVKCCGHIRKEHGGLFNDPPDYIYYIQEKDVPRTTLQSFYCAYPQWRSKIKEKYNKNAWKKKIRRVLK